MVTELNQRYVAIVTFISFENDKGRILVEDGSKGVVFNLHAEKSLWFGVEWQLYGEVVFKVRIVRQKDFHLIDGDQRYLVEMAYIYTQ